MSEPLNLLSIGLFGVLGVLTRYFVGLWVSKILPPHFPYGTFVINISGAFFIGIAYALTVERSLASPALKLGIITGFLGGYTTFSSYCLETIRLIEESYIVNAVLYVVLSSTLGLGATVAGMSLMRIFTK